LDLIETKRQIGRRDVAYVTGLQQRTIIRQDADQLGTRQQLTFLQPLDMHVASRLAMHGRQQFLPILSFLRQ